VGFGREITLRRTENRRVRKREGTGETNPQKIVTGESMERRRRCPTSREADQYDFLMEI